MLKISIDKLKIGVNNVLKKTGYIITRFHTIESKVKDGHYKWLQDFGIRTIIDVGANDGGFATLINAIIPDAYIYSFEPLEKCFENLKKNTIKISKIKLFNLALGDSEKELIFFENDFSPSSSFLEVKEQHIKSFPFTAITSPKRIQVKILDSFTDSIELNKKVLLKLDVQGFELEVLKGATKIIQNVDLIILEISFLDLFDSQPSFHEIYEFLYKFGFEYHGSFDQIIDPLTKIILQEDAIFIKKI